MNLHYSGSSNADKLSDNTILNFRKDKNKSTVAFLAILLHVSLHLMILVHLEIMVDIALGLYRIVDVNKAKPFIFHHLLYIDHTVNLQLTMYPPVSQFTPV